jgi:hypothetical protein
LGGCAYFMMIPIAHVYVAGVSGGSGGTTIGFKTVSAVPTLPVDVTRTTNRARTALGLTSSL